MQSSTQAMVYNKTVMMAMKARANDDNILGVTLMDAGNVSRKLQRANSGMEEEERFPTASTGNVAYEAPMKKKAPLAPAFFGFSADGKMDKTMMAQIWGLAAGCLMASGFSLLACAAAAMAVVLCLSRKEEAVAPTQKTGTSPWAAGPRSGAAPVKKSFQNRPPAPNSGSRKTAAPAAPQKVVILPPRTPQSTAPKMMSPVAKAFVPAPSATPGCTSELQKMLATPSTPVVTAAMRAQKQVRPPAKAFVSPPGLETPKVAPVAPAEYTPAGFRRELVSIMKELAQARNAAVAVGQVRMCGVPTDRQSAEFADILTRAMEERNGPVRRTYVAFAAGLAAGGENSAFNIDECVKGTGVFFSEVYEELCTEVSRLDKIVECELVPTLRAVLSPEVIKTVLPLGM